MNRLAILGLVLALPLAALGQEPDSKQVAQEILDKGSALFDTHDAAAIAASYIEDARLFLVGKNNDNGEYEVSTKEGRSQVEDFYRDHFKDSNEKTTSKNTVEFARFVTPDLVVIHGYFQPNTAKPDRYTFVQVRVKKRDKWLIQSLRLFML